MGGGEEGGGERGKTRGCGWMVGGGSIEYKLNELLANLLIVVYITQTGHIHTIKLTYVNLITSL